MFGRNKSTFQMECARPRRGARECSHSKSVAIAGMRIKHQNLNNEDFGRFLVLCILVLLRVYTYT